MTMNLLSFRTSFMKEIKCHLVILMVKIGMRDRMVMEIIIGSSLGQIMSIGSLYRKVGMLKICRSHLCWLGRKRMVK
jgi:hypothetical protein